MLSGSPLASRRAVCGSGRSNLVSSTGALQAIAGIALGAGVFGNAAIGRVDGAMIAGVTVRIPG
jgi:hypothetical protein